ncbi:ferredoxin--NADP+ reductase [Clostridium uliginosum]|uniref:Ferredoxin--NADP+ reductase n=1 Tax=Clostridium uliginosum TaxID=119641 RepID=A0A1I1PX49_9CLOT|nr:ferredoxin--NADP+ reductase [Clostridium uliginosum]
MYKIVSKRELTNNIFLIDIEAPRVAKSAKPDQLL